MRSKCPILSQYNSIYDYAVELFGKSSVTFTEREIKIKAPNMFLILLCSANEYKMYVRTFDVPVNDDKYNYADTYYAIHKEVGTFRIMDAETMKQYLLIKKAEYDFLLRNAD